MVFLERLLQQQRAFDGFPAGEWLKSRALRERVETAPPKKLVTGDHLLALGLPPGRALGRILQQCYEAQLDGDITTEAEGITLARNLSGEAG